MTNRWGISAAVFSLKCYIASMLATFIAFSIGLERPYWAFLTAYIVSGPFAGAVVSRALFRLIGTFVGACFAIFIAPPLAHSPVLLVSAMTCWLGFCVFLSLLDRKPTSYMFVLSGYTAGLIVWPIVDAPQHVFDVATLRAQEIAIGILCSALIHGVVLPGSVSRALAGRMAAILKDAEVWSRDTLDLEPDPKIDIERRRLAQDITELHQQSVHLPFETTQLAPRVKLVRAMEDNLAHLMPLGAAIADRIATLRAHEALPESTMALMADIRSWIDTLNDDLEAIEETGDALMVRCSELEPGIDAQSDWVALLHMSLVARLGELVRAHLNCRVLKAQYVAPSTRPVSARIPALLADIGERQLNRDYGGAARAAGGAMLTVVVGSLIWHFSGWSDGGTFLMLASVFPALFGAMDNSLPPVVGFFKGTVLSVVIAGAYGFAILPMLDGFPEMAVSLAPALLVLGALIANPKTAGFALPTMLGLGSPFIISEQYGADLGPGVPATFATFLNSQMATFVAIFFAAGMVRIIQTAGVHHAIKRSLRAGWNDLAERSNRWARPNLQGWISRMLDRQAQLGPRLKAAGKAPVEPHYDILRDLRAGVAVGELRALRLDIDKTQHAPLTDVLVGMQGYYRKLTPEEPPTDDPTLLARIDAALARFQANPVESVRRRAALPLITLRRTLFADAPPFTGVSTPPGGKP
ncbi:FUSC family protein [Novosphingobium decolorationis]|uniref:FUSC family protein n=1 Tax=Novosphingobium decolorationis TaxID=2698673 RepID=A0ABX8E2I8_9SPHN|nr:FUSC family protein [Novosphingobium decolorationis]QVM83159.1 FUSC family protein [Novosphingobium decolorationis]